MNDKGSVVKRIRLWKENSEILKAACRERLVAVEEMFGVSSPEANMWRVKMFRLRDLDAETLLLTPDRLNGSTLMDIVSLLDLADEVIVDLIEVNKAA